MRISDWSSDVCSSDLFHDGSPFTADDVLFTAERAQNVPNSPSSFGLYLKGKTFKKVDDYTVHVTTAKPYPLMANDLATKIGRANSELQSLMRISYAVFCLKKKKPQYKSTHSITNITQLKL